MVAGAAAWQNVGNAREVSDGHAADHCRGDGREGGRVPALRGRPGPAVRARPPRGPRGPRGIGHGRKTRRTLERGGTGAARRLNEALGGWPGVRITPMFGRWGYFAGPIFFACFPLRAAESDLWVRLTGADQRRALAEAGVRPHRRFAGRGWVEMDVAGPEDVGRALRWLRRAYAAARAGGEA
jgi:hypothetical protein